MKQNNEEKGGGKEGVGKEAQPQELLCFVLSLYLFSYFALPLTLIIHPSRLLMGLPGSHRSVNKSKHIPKEQSKSSQCPAYIII